MCSHGKLQAVLGGATPYVTDGQCQCVRGVRGLGRGVQSQDSGDHGGDLGLVGTTVAGHRSLHLGRGVHRQRQPEAGGSEHGNGGRLGGAHDPLDVGLGEHPLHGNGVRLVTRHPLVDLDLQGQQPFGRVVAGRSADHPDGDHPQRLAHAALDNAEAAPGQTGVDTQDTHAQLLTSSEHLFGQKPTARGPDLCQRRAEVGSPYAGWLIQSLTFSPHPRARRGSRRSRRRWPRRSRRRHCPRGPR